MRNERKLSEIYIDNVRKWYCDTFPDDDAWDLIPAGLTFSRLIAAFLSRRKTAVQKSIIHSWADSVIRERSFQEIADRLNVDYDLIYREWLGTAEW